MEPSVPLLSDPMATGSQAPLSGRRAQAARNDDADPRRRAGRVSRRPDRADHGRRQAGRSRDQRAVRRATPARRICFASCVNDGLQRFVDETEAALSDGRDDWTAFADYMRRLVDADTSSMTLALAGSFTPTAEMFALAERANELLARFFERVKGVLRPDLDVHDLSLIFELLAAIKLSDRGAHRAAAPPLPGDDPRRSARSGAEPSCRVRRRAGRSSTSAGSPAETRTLP